MCATQWHIQSSQIAQPFFAALKPFINRAINANVETIMDVLGPTDRLILGHMPLVGISYQSKEKDEEYSRRFSKNSAMRRVMDAAFRMGVRRFAAATPGSTPLSSRHLEVLKRIVDEGHDIELIPCIGIPIKVEDTRIDVFRRWATYVTLEERLYPDAKRRILNDPLLNFREGWKSRLPASKPYEEKDFRRLTIDWKRIEDDIEHFIDLPVAYMEPGSETDFLAMAGRFDLIGELVDRINERGFGGVLFGVHHAGITIPKIDEELEGFNGYVTPLNTLGLMMFPTKTSAEEAVRGTKKAVYAIKPLGGGRLKPRRAFAYAFSFDLEGCMVGAASVAEVEEDFNIVIEVLDGLGQ